MLKFLLIAVFGLNAISGACAASDSNSGNSLLPGCKGFFTSTDTTPMQAFNEGECFGAVKVLSGDPGKAFGICSPDNSTIGQSMRVVLNYMEQNPAKLHHPYHTLIIEALRSAWPCRK